MCIIILDVQNPQDGRRKVAPHPPHVADNSTTTDLLRRVLSTSYHVSEDPSNVDGTGPMQCDPQQVRVSVTFGTMSATTFSIMCCTGPPGGVSCSPSPTDPCRFKTDSSG
jgi:hypothetical protein